MGTVARAINRHFAPGAAIDRADFLTFGRAISFGAPLIADRTNHFFEQECLLRKTGLKMKNAYRLGRLALVGPLKTRWMSIRACRGRTQKHPVGLSRTASVRSGRDKP